ncbi:related to Protein VMS1 [Saccharomycodes ludwigii]|uniref:Related to Protein VMS1 n=1 Tax=Saccharomycodes ludwigii TaxID=36035 RepID=A0A376B1Q3_9ASCO|nr:hypothetical protein SCDLUD_003719 [Saccharomycodes ludwigii]KAH3900717.1 hypothetical protein SCDLUD_003719 [Saccharomycodes ludwigii]SSD58581.1 related to Protein VMS1 [Saccharomycodes ludwigii]
MDSTYHVKKDDLYIFHCSKEILDSLELMYFDENDIETINNNANSTDTNSNIKNNVIEFSKDASFCNACSTDISNREHYKTDFHRFNIKRRLHNLPLVNEEEFESIVNNDTESISGSDSDVEDEDAQDGDRLYEIEKDGLTTAFEKNMKQASLLTTAEKKNNNNKQASFLNTKSPYIFMKSKLIPENKILGAYKVLFSDSDYPLKELKGNLQLQEDETSAIFMIGGGHFAGAIVSHKRLKNITFNKKLDLSISEQMVNLLHQKTFHRYTTRRKQGGTQSANDNAKGKANSAGSNLRRYNERALKEDIANLLKEWSPFLKSCKYIFIRGNGQYNKKMLFDDNVLQQNDHRIKNFPFITKRPTASELKRAWCKLTYLDILNRPEKKRKKETEKQSFAINKVAKQQDLSKGGNNQVETPVEIKHTKELIQLVKKSKIPLLISYLKKNNLGIDFALQPLDQYRSTTPTLLHYAAANGLKNVIYILLNTLKADPTIKNLHGKVAADLASNLETQQMFQLARNSLGEEHCNWDTDAHVGVPLTREHIDKEKEELKKQEEEHMNEQLAKIKLEQENLKRENYIKKGVVEQRLGSDKASKKVNSIELAPSNVQQTLNSLNPEQRMRLMREQRARAAEARMRANIK